jgi:hypothetical protein
MDEVAGRKGRCLLLEDKRKEGARGSQDSTLRRPAPLSRQEEAEAEAQDNNDDDDDENRCLGIT